MNPQLSIRPGSRLQQSLVARVRLAGSAALIGRVRFVLGLFPIPTCDYIWYYNFGRQMLKIEGQFLPEVPKPVQVRELLAKYRKMGLKEEPLIRIIRDVFYLDWPPEADSNTKSPRHEEERTTDEHGTDVNTKAHDTKKNEPQER
jgi:hypothetical protein